MNLRAQLSARFYAFVILPKIEEEANYKDIPLFLYSAYTDERIYSFYLFFFNFVSKGVGEITLFCLFLSDHLYSTEKVDYFSYM